MPEVCLLEELDLQQYVAAGCIDPFPTIISKIQC